MKSPLVWLLAAGAAAVAVVALKSKKKASPSSAPGGGPSKDSCDTAYSALPPEWATAVDNATSAASASGDPSQLTMLADEIESSGTLDPMTAHTIANCLRANAAKMGGASAPSGTPYIPPAPSGGPLPGGLPSGLPSVAKPGGGYMPPPPSTASPLLPFPLSFNPIPTGPTGPLPPPPPPLAADWPMINRLPEPQRSQALARVDGMLYGGVVRGELWCTGSCPSSAAIREYEKTLLASPELEYFGTPRDAAILELAHAANILEGGGY